MIKFMHKFYLLFLAFFKYINIRLNIINNKLILYFSTL